MGEDDRVSGEVVVILIERTNIEEKELRAGGECAVSGRDGLFSHKSRVMRCLRNSSSSSWSKGIDASQSAIPPLNVTPTLSHKSAARPEGSAGRMAMRRSNTTTSGTAHSVDFSHPVRMYLHKVAFEH